MAKKTKSKIQPFIIKFVAYGLVAVLAGWAVGLGAKHLFKNSDYFRVRSVIIDSALPFVDKNDLKNLLGKNIFGVDLRAVQRRLNDKYPQASHLKVVRHFPGQIAVVAKQRHPFVQLSADGRTVILDTQGVVLALEAEEGKQPLVTGVKLGGQKIAQGLPLKNADLETVLAIVKNFQAEKNLSSYRLTKVHVESPSKIHLTLLDHPDVIVDRDKIAQRIKILGVILSQGQLDLKQVNYIDLRFREPVIGKK
jgi:cell division septal protein FtsQ